jgi:cysteine desulfurase/selenocysteine lyase
MHMNQRVRADFPVTREAIYLDTAYDGPYPVPVLDAGRAFLERRSKGSAGRVRDWMEVMDEVRHQIALLINASPSEIAITTSTTHGTNIVALSLPLGPGDNVVWGSHEYPSNGVVWLTEARRRGFENRIIQDSAGALDVSDFERAVDEHTRVISVSHVSHRNGHVLDLRGLTGLARMHGAYLHVDAIQSVGAIRVHVKETGVDFLTCGTYKWLLGPLGLAFFYIREDLLPEVGSPYSGEMQAKKWPSALQTFSAGGFPLELHETARKFEYATVHFQVLYELRAALDYIQDIGVSEIEAQVLRLSSQVWRGVNELGFEMLTPPNTASGIVTCFVEDGDEVAQLLERNKIVVSVKSGNQLRVSPHFFNTKEEVNQLLSVLRLAC